MTDVPDKDADKYFRLRTVWPGIIYIRRSLKVAGSKGKGRGRGRGSTFLIRGHPARKRGSVHNNAENIWRVMHQ